jgi:hypothetical protein
MTYYHWLGIEAEQFHEAQAYYAAFHDDIEDDGWITQWPKL